MTSPLDRLAMIQSQIDVLQAELPSLVAEARSQGESWRAIGERLGITTQGAQQRFGRKPATVADLPLSDPLFDPLFAPPKD